MIALLFQLNRALCEDDEMKSLLPKWPLMRLRPESDF